MSIQTNAAKIIDSALSQAVIGFVLTLIWLTFAYGHLYAFWHVGEWSYLAFFVSETFIAIMFLLRTRPKSVSSNPLDWVLGTAGTFAPLLLGPVATAVMPAAKSLLIIAAVFMLLGALSLNRSFGLVPARRTIKTSGMYALVRHPLYASYLILFTSYVLSNTSLRNVIVCGVSIGLMYLRIVREELHLSLDPDYRAYKARVKYRVIPYLF